jgi:hypothetical protein
VGAAKPQAGGNATAVALAATTRASDSRGHPIDVESPTLVSLHVRNAREEDVAARLTEQLDVAATVRFQQWNRQAELPPVTLDLDPQPLLMAVARVAAATNTVPASYGRDDGIMLVRPWGRRAAPASGEEQRSWLATPSLSSSGPFLVAARGASVQPRKAPAGDDAEFGPAAVKPPAPPAAASVTLSMTLLAEPKVRVVAWCPFVRVIEAKDERGNDLDPGEPPAKMWMERSGYSSPLDLSAGLRADEKLGQRVAHFRGVVTLRVVSEAETVEIRGLGVEHAIRAAGYRGKAGGIDDEGGGFSTDLSVSRGSRDAAEWKRFAELAADYSRFRALDLEGVPYLGYSSRWGHAGEEELSFSLRFGRSARQRLEPTLRVPAKLTWALSLATREIEVPVAFEDVAVTR